MPTTIDPAARRPATTHGRIIVQTYRVALAIGLVLTGACDSTPTAPTSPPRPPTADTPTSPNPPPSHIQARATGRVTDENGRPIAGASISSISPRVSAFTDADGSYDLSGPFGSAYGIGLIAIHAGYEPSYQWAAATAEAVMNFRLRGIQHIAPGEEVTVTVDADDSLYGSAEQYRVRRVRIVAPSKGHLVIEGTSSTGGPVLLSDREYEYSPCCPARLVVAVNSGQEVTVNVLTYWVDVPAQFFLTARLEPQ